MNSKCVLCSAPAGNYNVPSHTYEIYKIYKCSDCGLEYTNPIPSDETLQEFYSEYNDIRAQSEIVYLNAKKNLDKLYELGILNENSLVLDFGCGNGEFLEICGDNCYGVELASSRLNERIVNNLNALPIQKFDCVTLWGVLEHLNDINGIISEINKYIKDDGYLVITTVNAESSIPYYYKPPEHLTYWTEKSFSFLATAFDFKTIVYEPYVMKQFSAVYLDRLLSRTPEEIKKTIYSASVDLLPKIIEVPTNEIFVVLQKSRN